MSVREARQHPPAFRVTVFGLAKLAILLLAVLNLGAIAAQAPVFNAGMRIEGAGGDWRVGGHGSHFEEAAYFAHHALEHRMSLPLGALVGVRPEPFVTPMRDAAERSLAVAPADGYVWFQLAFAEALLGNRDAAAFALARSWEFTPQAPALAKDRLILAERLALLADEDVSAEVTSGVLTDVETVRRTDAGWWDGVRSGLIGVRGLVDGLEAGR